MPKAPTIGIVGAGPMATFLLKHLITAPQRLHIVLFEKERLAGPGMPYRQEMSPDFMLANIFSREIPTISQSLAEWLRSQPAEWLARWRVDPGDISARGFYPRTLLGAYLASQLQDLVTAGIAAGHKVEVRTQHDILDVIPGRGATLVTARTSDGIRDEEFDLVVLTTGHSWDPDPTEGEASLVSPWPAARLSALPAREIGILGSSLSAVDVAVTLAHAHGQFSDAADSGQPGLVWAPTPGHEGLRVTLVSRTGLLPEADFHYPYPYEPLLHLTEEAVKRLCASSGGQILQRTFDLLLQEIRACDPDYVADLAMPVQTIEAFGTAYFARRQRLGAFQALRTNLAQSRATLRQGRTIAWRYALLRGHEVFEAALPHLTPDEWETFRGHLLPVFADCYAAVPHLSLDRLLAMRDADVIDIVNTGEEAQFLTAPDDGVIVRVGDIDHHFAAMVDARGQVAALPKDLPFPSLVAALSDLTEPLDAPFRLNLGLQEQAPVYCLSMPQVLVRHPFSQGLPNCDALSHRVAATLLRSLPTQ